MAYAQLIRIVMSKYHKICDFLTWTNHTCILATLCQQFLLYSRGVVGIKFSPHIKLITAQVPPITLTPPPVRVNICYCVWVQCVHQHNGNVQEHGRRLRLEDINRLLHVISHCQYQKINIWKTGAGTVEALIFEFEILRLHMIGSV